MNAWRACIVGLLIVALPMSATASLAASLSCPHQGLGAPPAAHDHRAMHAPASLHHAATRATTPHDAAPSRASMSHEPVAMAAMYGATHDGAPGAHHACDCAHHCAAAPACVAVPTLAFDALVAPSAVSAYRSLHSDSAELPLLRPPIATAA